MIHDRKFAEKYTASNRDMILEFYCKIGISAVAAVLEATSGKPQGPMPSGPKKAGAGPIIATAWIG
jgi:hypothetical protein